VWLLADLGAAMFFGTRKQLKSSVVVRASALLAWTAAAGGDRVGAVVVGTSSYKILAPRAREAGVLSVLAALIDMQPTAPAPPSQQSVNDGLRALAPLIHPGSLILALSDFATPDEELESSWATLASHNEFQLFWVTDPLERDSLPDGRFRVGIPGRSMSVEGAETRAAWMRTWHERERRLAAWARRLAAPVTQLDTSQSAQTVLQGLLAKRTAA
jgi:uncharacterized protein (DUF58 family)